MLEAIKYNLRHLLDFSGRDARQTFWFYVLFLVLLSIAVSMVAMIPVMGGMMGTAMDAARSGASEEVIEAQMQAQMGGMMGSMVWVSVASNLVMILMLAAAFVRRLHDAGRSGWWALVAVVAQIAGVIVSLQVMEAMQAVMTAGVTPENLPAIIEEQRKIGALGLVGWIAPIVVVVFGVMKSTDGPNAYGEEPVRF